ncbi:MAG: hypothetical protein KAR35_04440 [Candidatus Heimdallarchaeota archaeon]|nr:hypothetical protein [Candidatus Heimdallarchaeota archaeon]MCK5048604.1 hypothetical protein [Candidatus Heimdallarchaeota archaeon]
MGRRSKKDQDNLALGALEELITQLKALVKQSTDALSNRVAMMEKRVEDFENDISQVIEAVASFQNLTMGTPRGAPSKPSSGPSAPSVGAASPAPVQVASTGTGPSTPTPGKQKTGDLNKPGAPKL